MRFKYAALFILFSLFVTGAAAGVDGDLDGNGRADLIWQNYTTSQAAFWLLDGATVADGGFLGPVRWPWHVVGTGDFTGDGKTDICWNEAYRVPGGANGNGTLTVWQLTGPAYSSQVTLSFLRWATLVAVADYDGDGDADLIGRNHSTGTNSVTFMNGYNPVSGVMAPPEFDLAWEIAGGDDIDGDGKGDIVWWNSATSDVAIWFMDGASRLNNIYVGRPAEAGWKVVAVGDFNGEGHADLAWQNDLGDVAIWFLAANGSVVDGAYVGRVADTAWRITGPK